MENAAKALIIAAEILIALIIITAIVMGYTSIQELQKEKSSIEKQEQLIVFNKEYESYNRKLLRGVDVISVMNRAIDNNSKYENEEYYRIDVEFIMKEELAYYKYTYKQNGKEETSIATKKFFKVGQKYNLNNFSEISADAEAFTDFKRRIFDCTKMEYGKTSGRVNYILFEERKMSTNEYNQGL